MANTQPPAPPAPPKDQPPPQVDERPERVAEEQQRRASAQAEAMRSQAAQAAQAGIVVDEQRQRSAEIETEGVEAHKRRIDERTDEQKRKDTSVPGVRHETPDSSAKK